MNKIKIRNRNIKKQDKKKTDIRKYVLKKIDSLSWEMGERKYSLRKVLYDR